MVDASSSTLSRHLSTLDEFPCQVRALVGDRISLVVQVTSALTVSIVVAFIVLWKLALVIIVIQPLILLCYYMKKVILTRIAVASTKAQQDAAQVASEAVAQHRTVTAFSAQDKVKNFCPVVCVHVLFFPFSFFQFSDVASHVFFLGQIFATWRLSLFFVRTSPTNFGT